MRARNIPCETSQLICWTVPIGAKRKKKPDAVSISWCLLNLHCLPVPYEKADNTAYKTQTASKIRVMLLNKEGSISRVR